MDAIDKCGHDLVATIVRHPYGDSYISEMTDVIAANLHFYWENPTNVVALRTANRQSVASSEREIGSNAPGTGNILEFRKRVVNGIRNIFTYKRAA